MLRLKTNDSGFEAAFRKLVRNRRESDDDVARDVTRILAEVRARGDEALTEYTQRFDGHALATEADWRIAPEQCRDAFVALPTDLRQALELAAERIIAYHQAQLPQDRDFTDHVGVRLGAKWRAVDAAGLYIPGGRASYP